MKINFKRMSLQDIQKLGFKIISTEIGDVISTRRKTFSSGIATRKNVAVIEGLVFKTDPIFKYLQVIEIKEDFGGSIFGSFKINFFEKEEVF